MYINSTYKISVGVTFIVVITIIFSLRCKYLIKKKQNFIRNYTTFRKKHSSNYNIVV